MTAGTAYYIAWCADSTTPKLTALSQASIPLIGNAISYPANSSGIDATDTCTAGVLPSTITITNITNTGSMTIPYALISN